MWLNKRESAWKNTYQVIKIVYVGWGSRDKEGRQVSFITTFAFCIIMFLHNNFYLYAFPIFSGYPHSLASVPLLYLQSQQWLRGVFFTSYPFDPDSSFSGSLTLLCWIFQMLGSLYHYALVNNQEINKNSIYNSTKKFKCLGKDLT